MDDSIYRQAAIDALGTPHGILYPIRTIEELPSAPPEIVRCRDCKHFNSYFVECDHESGLKRIKDDHDHCCHADRRSMDDSISRQAKGN